MKNNLDTRIAALAKHLDCDPSDVSDTGDGVFEAEGGEYLVLTDSEADARAKDYIRESAWAFNPEFVLGHTDLEGNEGIEILRTIGEKCEGGNRAMLALIKDFDHFAEDAMAADGRGRFLASYDGEEVEEGDFYIYRVN